MKKIMFLCNWGESPAQLLKRYGSQTPDNSGTWGDIVGVTNLNEADYYIALEGYNGNLPQDKTIFVKREPNFIRNFKPNYKHVIDWDESNCGITWWVNKSYDEFKAMPYPDKTKKVSCIVSSKHTYRANYVKSLFKEDSPIELYGRGHDRNYYGENYKGSLDYDGKCKLRGLVDYEYSIVLENSQQINYWTEKLADAYLSWSIPIYWGCPNVDDFFDPLSYRCIDLYDPEPGAKIKRILEAPVTDDIIESLRRSRNKILDEYNIWEIVRKKIRAIEDAN